MSYTPRYAHRRHPGSRKYQTKLQITYLFFDFSLFHVRVMTNRRAHCNKGVGDVGTGPNSRTEQMTAQRTLFTTQRTLFTTTRGCRLYLD